MKAICGLIALTVIFAEEISATGFWEQTNGPFGGYVYSLSMDSVTGDFLAGTANGIYRSTVGGYSWCQTGLADIKVLTMAINAQGHIFAGTNWGLFRSLDNCESWEWLNDELGETVYAVGLNSNGHLFATFVNNGIFRSTDNGDSWVEINNGLETEQFHSILITSEDVIFLGPWWGMHTNSGGIYRSTDNGDSWDHLQEGLPLYGGDYYSFASDVDGDIFAATFGEGIFRSSDHGETWSWVSSGLPTRYIYSLAIDPEGRLFAGTYGFGIFLSINDGHDWIEINAGMRSDNVYCIMVDSFGEVSIGTRSGVFQSSDHGESWVQTNSGLKNTVVRCLTISQMNEIFAGTWGNGLFRSSDKGSTWIEIDGEISDIDITGVVMTTDGQVFVGTLYDGVFRSTDNGDHWSQVNNGLTQTHIIAIAVSPDDHLFVGIQQSNSSDPSDIYRSTDNGESWTAVYDEPTVSSVNSIGINSEGVIFASVCCGGRILRSTDGGESWSQVFYVGVVGKPIVFNSHDHIFFGVLGQYGIYRSTDSGDSWKPLSEDIKANALSIDSSDGIFAGTTSGRVFHSTDNGDSWVEISAGLPSDFIFALAADLDDFIYVGMWDHGVFRSVESPVFIHREAARLDELVPEEFPLEQNFLNPFNPSTTVPFEVPAGPAGGQSVTLAIYDIRGTLVRTLIQKEYRRGTYQIVWDGRDNAGGEVSSGIYFYNFRIGQKSYTGKLLVQE